MSANKEKTPWRHTTPIDTDKFYGFIYIIKNYITNKEYIGKKAYKYTLRIKVKGRKNRKIVIKDSDWETYTGSSKELNKDIKEFGIDNCSFTILCQCTTRSMLTYMEVDYLVSYYALTSKDTDGERLFYNRMIPAIKFIPVGEVDYG